MLDSNHEIIRDRSGAFFFNDTATTEIYTLSLHDALPILGTGAALLAGVLVGAIAMLLVGAVKKVIATVRPGATGSQDRKSTRLNSSHANISYAVFCLKKKLPPA